MCKKNVSWKLKRWLIFEYIFGQLGFRTITLSKGRIFFLTLLFVEVRYSCLYVLFRIYVFQDQTMIIVCVWGEHRTSHSRVAYYSRARRTDRILCVHRQPQKYLFKTVDENPALRMEHTSACSKKKVWK